MEHKRFITLARHCLSEKLAPMTNTFMYWSHFNTNANISLLVGQATTYFLKNSTEIGIFFSSENLIGEMTTQLYNLLFLCYNSKMDPLVVKIISIGVLVFTGNSRSHVRAIPTAFNGWCSPKALCSENYVCFLNNFSYFCPLSYFNAVLCIFSASLDP